MSSASPASPDTDPLQYLPLVERVVERVGRRHVLSREELEDFSSHVKVKLFENDFAAFRRFRGNSSFPTYLTIVVSRMLLDYRAAAWGKWRPSAEARRLGPQAMLLERLCVRDGFTVDEACEILVTNHQVSASRQELETLLARLPMRARRRFEPEEAFGDLPAGDPSPEEGIAARERETSRHRVTSALARLVMTLEPEDRLLLALHFKDGRKVSDIARLLHLDQKRLYRRLERILADLRNSLQRQGFDDASVAELLQ